MYVPRRLICSLALVWRQSNWVVGSWQKQVNPIFVQLIYLYSLNAYDRFWLLLEEVVADNVVDRLLLYFFLQNNIFPLLYRSWILDYFSLAPVYNLRWPGNDCWIPWTGIKSHYLWSIDDGHYFFSFDFFFRVATYRGVWPLLHVKLRLTIIRSLMLFFAIRHSQLLLDGGFLDRRHTYMVVFVQSHAMPLSVRISRLLFSGNDFLRRFLHLRLLRNLAAKLEHYHLAAHVIVVIVRLVVALIRKVNFDAHLVPRVCLVWPLVDKLHNVSTLVSFRPFVKPSAAHLLDSPFLRYLLHLYAESGHLYFHIRYDFKRLRPLLWFLYLTNRGWTTFSFLELFLWLLFALMFAFLVACSSLRLMFLPSRLANWVYSVIHHLNRFEDRLFCVLGFHFIALIIAKLSLMS